MCFLGLGWGFLAFWCSFFCSGFYFVFLSVLLEWLEVALLLQNEKHLYFPPVEFLLVVMRSMMKQLDRELGLGL